MTAILDGHRVIDLTGPEGWLAGLLLAGFGAEVIKVEPPGGDRGRRLPPLAGETSLYWAAWNRGKKSVTLDLSSPAGAGAARALASTASFVVESGTPGWLASPRLDEPSLRATNPELIYVSISPFGQDGPFASYAASDLTAQAAGGHLYLDGLPEQPMRPSFDSSYAQAGVQATVGALLAHSERLNSGRGQHVDVSLQEVIVATLDWYTQGWDVDHVVRRRAGVARDFADGFVHRTLFRCKDGWVTSFSYFDVFGPNGSNGRGLYALGGVEIPEPLATRVADTDYIPSDDEQQELCGLAVTLAARFERAALIDACQDRRILSAEILTPRELLSNHHLRARNFWQPAEIPGLGDVDLPGPPFLHAASLWRTPASVAAPGEHNAELLRPTVAPAVAPKPALARTPRAGGIFEGIRIADFSWVGVGPLTTKYFADQGAEVIRVESSHHMDVLRYAGPFVDGKPDINGSPYYANFNSSKLGAALNMSHPEAKELALRLIERCDVVAESYRPGVMERWRLTYEEAHARRPDIIWLRMPMFGLAGPWFGRAGYGHTLQGLVGVHHMLGLPDGEPLGSSTAFTDFFGPHVAAVALAAALIHRRQTGEGQLVEYAQFEAGTYLLGPHLLAAQFGAEPIRDGNHHLVAAPHNVYGAAGEDRWLALACFDDAQWAALVGEMGNPSWADGPEFANQRARKEHEAALDEYLAPWVARFAAEELMHRLQARGVPAAVVATVEDLRKDPQLAHRNHFRFLDHPTMGRRAYDAPSFRLSATPEYLSRPGPLLGQHNDYVWRELVGLPESDLDRLLIEGALE